MSRNLKAFMQEEVSYSADELAAQLIEVVPGRGVGERFVASAKPISRNVFVIILDDESQYQITCEKLT